MGKQTIRRSLTLTPEQAITLYSALKVLSLHVFDKRNIIYTESLKTRERILKLYPEIEEYVEK
jgi:hypothetical protein